MIKIVDFCQVGFRGLVESSDFTFLTQSGAKRRISTRSFRNYARLVWATKTFSKKTHRSRADDIEIASRQGMRNHQFSLIWHQVGAKRRSSTSSFRIRSRLVSGTSTFVNIPNSSISLLIGEIWDFTTCWKILSGQRHQYAILRPLDNGFERISAS